LGQGHMDVPLPAAGVHRQILFTTVGWFVGYYLMKRTEYIYAKTDRELLEYVRHHPEDFKVAEKKRIGELLEDFYPIR
ncbi:NDUC2 dehydrogenase, partial [Tyrannus savana]|nr:NDUC2 dehydrogenase [Tyrannus savana]